LYKSLPESSPGTSSQTVGLGEHVPDINSQTVLGKIDIYLLPGFFSLDVQGCQPRFGIAEDFRILRQDEYSAEIRQRYERQVVL
jgi:hypothetical protein